LIRLLEIGWERARETVEARHGSARFLYTSQVHFFLGSGSLLMGSVHVFELGDGKMVSAWMADDPAFNGPRLHVVVHGNSIVTPVDAVRSLHR
jgi:hypothetical protein